jgi:hypothetical protein
VIEKRSEALLKKKLSSDAKAAAEAIKTSCGQHADSVDLKVMGPALNAAADMLVEADKQHTLQSLKMVFTNCNACAQKGHLACRKPRTSFKHGRPTHQLRMPLGSGSDRLLRRLP